MPIVEVRDLTKTFSVERKEAGLRGSFKSIVLPELRRVEAVKGITFSLKPGELLAFTFFGNALQLSRVIAQGQLDYYRHFSGRGALHDADGAAGGLRRRRAA